MTKQYGIVHEPLMARIQPNRRDPSKAIAFIGGQLCFLERDSITPPMGNVVEVMITRAMYGRHPEGHQYAGHTDHGSLRALMIEVVDPARHVLVAIDGFECSGSMCRTTATGRVTDGTRPLTSEDVYPEQPRGMSGTAWSSIQITQRMWLTPGRCDIFTADNVNSRFYKQEPTPVRPTNVWVERAILAEKGGCGVRVAGLTRIEDGQWARLVRQPSARRAA